VFTFPLLDILDISFLLFMYLSLSLSHRSIYKCVCACMWGASGFTCLSRCDRVFEIKDSFRKTYHSPNTGQKRYNKEHFKTAGATTTLFEIYADIVHPLSHDIYFVHGSSIKITKTNMNSFHVLQVQGN
jgi:hypothetical protein